VDAGASSLLIQQNYAECYVSIAVANEEYYYYWWGGTDKGMVRSDMSKPALIFFFTARVHITKYTVKILAANTHCKYFLKTAEHGQYSSLPDPWRNVHP
jgi:hypothetical protein